MATNKAHESATLSSIIRMQHRRVNGPQEEKKEEEDGSSAVDHSSSNRRQQHPRPPSCLSLQLPCGAASPSRRQSPRSDRSSPYRSSSGGISRWKQWFFPTAASLSSTPPRRPSPRSPLQAPPQRRRVLTMCIVGAATVAFLALGRCTRMGTSSSARETHRAVEAQPPPPPPLPSITGSAASSLWLQQETTVSGDVRNCTSPEYSSSKDWPLGGCPASQVSGTSAVNGQSCGLCQQTEFARHLQELALELQRAFETTCKDQVVIFGAAFGKKYFDWIWKRRWKPPRGKAKTTTTTTPCHFVFVLDETLRVLPTRRQTRAGNVTRRDANDTLSASPRRRLSELPPPRQKVVEGLLPRSTVRTDGRCHVVGVRRSALPYLNHRRNIKLFKLNAHLLFGQWAPRLLWVDAKLKLPPLLHGGPARIQQQVERFFDESVQKPQVCGAVVSMPLHPSTMGRRHESLPTVRLASHCQAIRDAFSFRPQVSDSAHSIQTQCQHYLQQTVGHDDLRVAKDDDLAQWVAPPLDATLIDSAILAWDLTQPRCQTFVANLLCTWLSEIHCFSDRDQLSFPYALQQTLGEPQMRGGSFPEDASYRVLHGTVDHDETPEPLLAFVPSQCHWYYDKAGLFKCHERNATTTHPARVLTVPTRELANDTSNDSSIGNKDKPTGPAPQ